MPSEPALAQPQSPPKQQQLWSPEEVDFLRANASKGSRWIAGKLERSTKCIREKAGKLKIKLLHHPVEIKRRPLKVQLAILGEVPRREQFESDLAYQIARSVFDDARIVLICESQISNSTNLMRIDVASRRLEEARARQAARQKNLGVLVPPSRRFPVGRPKNVEVESAPVAPKPEESPEKQAIALLETKVRLDLATAEEYLEYEGLVDQGIVTDERFTRNRERRRLRQNVIVIATAKDQQKVSANWRVQFGGETCELCLCKREICGHPPRPQYVERDEDY